MESSSMEDITPGCSDGCDDCEATTYNRLHPDEMSSDCELELDIASESPDVLRLQKPFKDEEVMVLIEEYLLLSKRFQRLRDLARISVDLLFLTVDCNSFPGMKEEVDQVQELINDLLNEREIYGIQIINEEEKDRKDHGSEFLCTSQNVLDGWNVTDTITIESHGKGKSTGLEAEHQCKMEVDKGCLQQLGVGTPHGILKIRRDVFDRSIDEDNDSVIIDEHSSDENDDEESRNNFSPYQRTTKDFLPGQRTAKNFLFSDCRTAKTFTPFQRTPKAFCPTPRAAKVFTPFSKTTKTFPPVYKAGLAVYDKSHGTFKDRFQLEKYLKSLKENKWYKCKFCSKAVRSKDSLQSHIEAQHLENKLHNCKICGLGFALRSFLLTHLQSGHMDKSFKNGKVELNKHMKIRRKTVNDKDTVEKIAGADEKMYFCNKCDLTFQNEFELDKHIKTCRETVDKIDIVAEKTSLQENFCLCSKCDLTFQNEMELNKHVNTGEKYDKDEETIAVEDNICHRGKSGLKFKNEMEQNQYKETRSVGTLSEKCGKSRESVQTQRNLLACSTAKMNHKCSKCGRTFDSELERTQHVDLRQCTFLIKKQSSRYSICSHDFNSKNHLKAHDEFDKNGPQKCKVCSKTFAFKKYLDKHMQLMHRVVKRPWRKWILKSPAYDPNIRPEGSKLMQLLCQGNSDLEEKWLSKSSIGGYNLCKIADKFLEDVKLES